MGRCDQMFRSGFCQGRDWGPSWAQVGQSGSSYASPLTAVGTGVGRGDTHITQLRTPQQCQACASTHTCTCSCTDTRYTHKHSLPPWQRHPQPPPAVRILYPRGRPRTIPLLPGPHLPQAGLFPPRLVFSPPSSHGALPSRSTQGAARPACGAGEEAKISSLPSRLPSLPTPALDLSHLLSWGSHPPGASHPPIDLYS